MRKRTDDYDEGWFAKLDAIVMGKKRPSQEDDDLLHVAAKLSDALSSLDNVNPTKVPNYHPAGINSLLLQYKAILFGNRKYVLLTGLALFCVLFGIFRSYFSSAQIAVTALDIGRQSWRAATTFDQVDASSVALLAVKKAGVRPLLPEIVPVDTQSIEFAIITDDVDPQDFIAFVASYRIVGQDLSVYEQAANLLTSSSAAQNITVGTNRGRLFQDSAGNSILQWYQDGMTCQIASMLPINELLAFARQFHPITQWELVI